MNRRHALRAGAAIFGLPWQKALFAAAPPLPADTLFKQDQEAYWKRIRDEQFYLPNWRAFLNNGSLGVAPRLRNARRISRRARGFSRLQEGRASADAQRDGGAQHGRRRYRPQARR